MANGMQAIFMVKEDAQIAFAERYREGFKNSYSAFWEAFGAREIEGRGAFTLPIPPGLNPLTDVTHKGRAALRRRNWSEIHAPRGKSWCRKGRPSIPSRSRKTRSSRSGRPNRP